MPVVKFDVSGSDPEKALAGTGEPPKPGVYPAIVKEINPGFSKDEKGTPDKERPRLEVVFALQDNEHKGFPLWVYLTFTEASQWKYDQFLQAMGIADTKKRKGQFKTEDYVGKPCRIRVTGGAKQDGSYRAEVGAMLPAGDDAEVGGGTVSDDDFTDMGDGDGEMVEETGTDEDLWTEESLTALGVPELKEVAKQYEVPVSGKKKAEVVTLVLEAQQALIDAAAAEGDDGEIISDDEEIIEDDSDKLTEEQLKAMDIPALKEAAAKFSVPTSGKKKSEVIAAILAAQEGGDSGGSGDDDLPF